MNRLSMKNSVSVLTKQSVFLLGVFILSLFGCKEKKNNDLVFSVSETELNFTNSGGKKSFDVMCNREWNAESNQTWCTLSTVSGNVNTTIDVSVQSNSSNAARTAVITVKASGSELNRKVTVTQAAGQSEGPVTDPDGHSLNATPAQLDFAVDGGSETVQVEANVEWSVKSNQTWCIVMPSSGFGNGSVKVTAGNHSGLESRSATLTVSNGEYKLNKEVTVVQLGIEPTIVISSDTKEIEAAAATFDVNVTANVTFEVTPEVTWLTVTQQTAAKVTLQVQANTGLESRSGTATFKQIDGNVTATLTVTQAGAEPAITLTPGDIEIGGEAETFSIDVAANVAFDVTPDAEWISVTQATDAKVTFHAQSNMATTSRTGTIAFTQTDGSATATLAVTQRNGIVPSIVVSPDTKNIGAEAETFDVNVTANVEFDVTSNVTWLTATQITAVAVTLQAQTNLPTVNRTGTVTFQQKDGSASATLTVTQEAGQPGVFYVSPTGNDNNDGRSWNTAMQTISTAIYAAPAGWQVWVEEGSYSQIVVLKNGVNVYGGFNRTETSIEERGTGRSAISGNPAISMAQNFTTPTVIDGFRLDEGFTLYRYGIVNNCTINITKLPTLIISGGTISNSSITTDGSTQYISISGYGQVLNCRISCSAYSSTNCAISLSNGRMEGCIVQGYLYYNPNDPNCQYSSFVRYTSSNNYIINCTFNFSKMNAYWAYDFYSFVRTDAATTPLNFANNIVLPSYFYTGTPTSNPNNLVNRTIQEYFLNDDYSPMPYSPAVNKGDNSYVTLEKDILGNPRIQNGTVDIGAVESPY